MNKLTVIERNLCRYFLLAMFLLSVIVLGQTSAAQAQVEIIRPKNQPPRRDIPQIRRDVPKVDADISKYLNLAAGKAVRQSSTAYEGAAERAVDGETNGDWLNNSVTHTAGEKQPWWEVDLGRAYAIGRIDLWNRTDCCTERLNNFIIFISKEPFKSNDPTEIMKQEGVFSFRTLKPVEKATPYTYYTPVTPLGAVSITTGRYVRIQLQNSGILSLAEVQVFRKP